MTDTRQALPPNGEPLHPEEWSAGYEQGFADALSAQPVAGAVAQPVQECADNDSPWLVCKKCAVAGQCEKTAPAPEPSAQAVMTELEQRLIEIAKALPPMTTLGWNDGGMCEPDEAIKGYTKKQVLEILAQHLSASPQPEPSAQGEPVATVTEEMVTAYLTANDAYWKRIDGEPTKLGKWRNGTPSEATRISLMAALASAPSTPPPEVVEAVPLEIDYDALITAAFKLHRYRQGTGACIAFKRGAEWMRDQVGIAPKAAQP
jgi:hypothetical protein